MSFLNENRNALPHASHGTAPVLDGVPLSPASRPAAFSQPFIPQAGGPADPPALNFQIARSLRMHSRLAWLTGLAIFLLLIALGLKQPRTYTATSVIYVEPIVAKALNEQIAGPGFDQFRYGSFLDQQMQTIVRPDVLAAALRTLPSGTWRGQIESEQAAVARLAKALTVERALTSYQITVKLKASNPEAAANIVNAVTNAYLQRGREDEFKQSDQREQILSEERDRVRQQLDTDRKEQAALGASMGLASPADGAINPYDTDLATLRTQLSTARQARDVAAAQLASVSGQAVGQDSGLAAAADEANVTDPGLSANRSAVNARRVVLEGLMAGMTPSNPQYRQDQDELADLNRALTATTAEIRMQTEQRIQNKLRTDLERTAEVESRINAQLAQATAKATGAGPKLQRAAELSNDIQRLTARYTTIDEALTALQIETSGPGMAHVPLPAVVPLSPDPNRRNLFFMAALPLGLLFGVSTAVVARLRDRRVYLGSDLQQAIGFAPIAVLPAREDVSKRVTEEYALRVAAAVESAYRTSGAQSFVVTAVSPNTDIHTLLGELASRLGDLRLRVLAIKAWELLVTSPETLEHDAAHASTIAGRGTPQTAKAGEGIASAKIDRMKSRHNIILIEAAPVLHSAETEYAARCADATILVAESAVTETTELAAATALLSRLRVSGVGAVLDHLKLDQADEPFRNAVRVVEQRKVEAVASPNPGARREAVAAPKTHERAPSAASPLDIPPAESAVEPAAVQASPEDPKPGNPLHHEAATAALATIPEQVPVLVVAADAPAAANPASIPAEASAPTTAVTAAIGTPPRPFSPGAVAQPAEAVPPAPAVLEPIAVALGWPGREGMATPPRSFKNCTVQSDISPAQAEEVMVSPGIRQHFELLADLADALPAAPSPATMQRASGPILDPTEKPESQSPRIEDPAALGRFVGEKDTVGAVPSYTRSRIRLAFKEQEVNSKTTWFSKLFRGDPPSNFRIIPGEAEENAEYIETPKLQWKQPLERLPEPVVANDPELSHLLNRIKPSDEPRIVARPRAITATEPELAPLAVSPIPFVERRTLSRAIEIDSYRAPAAEPESVAAAPEPPFWEPLVEASITPFLAPAPSSELPAPPLAQARMAEAQSTARPLSDSRDFGRPLRPLTFQQLAGNIEAGSVAPDDAHAQPSEPLEAVPPSLAPPEPEIEASEPPQGFEQVSAPVEVASAPFAEVPEIPIAPPAVGGWEIPPTWRESATEPITTQSSPATTSVGHTGVPMWPAKEPLPSSYVPAFQVAEVQSESEPALSIAAADAAIENDVTPETSVPHSELPRPTAATAAFVPSSLAARRVVFERIPMAPDPLSDPAPAPRPYRFDITHGNSSRVPAEEPAPEASASGQPTSASAAGVPAAVSFPPDHEARAQMFGRRKTDRAGGGSDGLTRRWKLLSQFEPVVTDPLPAHRKGYTRSTDAHPPRRSDEG